MKKPINTFKFYVEIDVEGDMAMAELAKFIELRMHSLERPGARVTDCRAVGETGKRVALSGYLSTQEPVKPLFDEKNEMPSGLGEIQRSIPMPHLAEALDEIKSNGHAGGEPMLVNLAACQAIAEEYSLKKSKA